MIGVGSKSNGNIGGCDKETLSHEISRQIVALQGKSWLNVVKRGSAPSVAKRGKAFHGVEWQTVTEHGVELNIMVLGGKL